jgi:hypothetical protein
MRLALANFIFTFASSPTLPPMDLLFSIQADVLKQKEQEALNYFSYVQELREFILTTRPDRDVVATLKLRCVSAERLNGGASAASQRESIERPRFPVVGAGA